MGEPPFYEEPPEDIEVGYGNAFTMFLPTPQSSSEEEEAENIAVEIQMGVAKRFVKFNPIEGSLTIKKGMTMEEDIGGYYVQIKLSTESGLKNEYGFQLKVVDSAPLSLVPIPIEEELDAQGKVMETQVYVAPTGVEETPEPSLEHVSNIGEATIAFSRSMFPIKNLTELKNATVLLEDYGLKPAIEIEALAGNDTDQSLLDFEYEITYFDADEMVV